MQDKKPTIEDIAVPEKVESDVRAWAQRHGYVSSDVYINCVKVVLLSLATNPVVPSDAELNEMYDYATGNLDGSRSQNRHMCVGWMKIAFLRRPDPLTDEQNAVRLLGKLVNFINEEGPSASAWKPISDTTEEARQLLEKIGKESVH